MRTVVVGSALPIDGTIILLTSNAGGPEMNLAFPSAKADAVMPRSNQWLLVGRVRSKSATAAQWRPSSPRTSGCGTSSIREISFNASSRISHQTSEKKLTSIDWLFRRVHDLVMKQPRDVLEHSILTP